MIAAAMSALDTLMTLHHIERCVVQRAWHQSRGMHLWTVRVGTFDVVVESEPHERLPEALVEAVWLLGEKRREIARENGYR